MPLIRVLKDGKYKQVSVMDDRGRITLPVDIRKKFKGCGFIAKELDGKIVLEPIKLEE